MDEHNTEIEWYQLARESVKVDPIENANETAENPSHIGVENHDSVLPTAASSQHNTLQLSSRRLSELSDTQIAELLTDDSNVDFSVHKGGAGDRITGRKNDMRLTLQERIDGQISESNPNVYLDDNLSPISLGDDSHVVADMNDTTILLQRAHEANCFFSTNEDGRIVKDPEWHSLQSSIMQVISRPEPLGYARCDSGNDSANFTGNLSNAYGDNKIESFIPLRNQNCELPDDANVFGSEKNNALSEVSNVLNQTPFYTKGVNKDLMKVHLENKIVSFATKVDDIESHTDKSKEVSTTENIATETLKDTHANAFSAKDAPQISSVGCDNSSIHSSIKDGDDQGAAQLDLSPVKEDNENSILMKDKYKNSSDSQCSDILFVPSITTVESQSIPGSLLLQSLCDTSNSLKSDIQRLFSKDGSSHVIDQNVTNNPYMKDYMDSYTNSSDLVMGDSINVDDLIRKKLSYSAKKNHDIRKDFRTPKPNLTSSVKGANAPSYSFSSSMQSTLGSTNFCIRKIVDEKIEISRGLGGYKGVISTDSTLTNSVSETGVGVMPQFNLTSLSSVEGKTSNLNSEEGTIPSLPSSFSEPSYQNVPTKSDSSVSRLLGSTFKKTEDFLKKLEKLELPYLKPDLVKVSENDTNSSATNTDNLYNTNINSGLGGDETNKLYLTKYEESDGEVLQLSDDEILVEQDINTASIMEPVSDATLQSGGIDGSHLLRAETKMSDNGSLKASDLHITSDEDLGITDIGLGKLSTSKIDTVAKISNLIAGNSDDNGRGNKKVDHRYSDISNRRHFDQKKREIMERKSKYRYNIDSTTSPESDYSTEKFPNTSGIEHHLAEPEGMKNAEILFNRKSYTLPDNRRNRNYSTVKPGKPSSNVIPGKASSVPRDTTILKMLMKNTSENTSSDEYINLKGGNVSRSDLLRGDSKEHKDDSYKAIPSGKSYNGEGSRNEKLETSLNKLLYEYEKPVKGKFSESPLIKKLELLSKILKEAKLKRSSSYASDTSDTSSINISENATSLLDRKISEKKSSNAKVDECVISKERSIPITPKSIDIVTSSNSVCSNCRRRDASTNCPTPCVSSDEASVRSKPLTLQIWTQTKEQPETIIDDIPSRAVPPRKRWSREENSTEILNEVVHVEKEDIQPENGKKRERKNTFVLDEPPPSSTFDSSAMEEKGRGCPAWYFSFASDDSQSIPINDVPDLNRAYLENRGEGRDALYCHYSKSQMNLQEAFQLHKKDFIKESKDRVISIKDDCLKKKHSKRQLKKSTKPIHFAVTKEVQEKPKKAVKVRKPVATVKKAWVPKKFDYNEMNEKKLQEKRINRLKMKNYDMKIREGFLIKRTRAPNSRKNIYFIERH